MLMKSTVERMHRLAQEDSTSHRAVFFNINPVSILASIEIGAEGAGNHAEGRKVEVWIHTRRLLSEFKKDTLSLIEEYDTIGEDNRIAYADEIVLNGGKNSLYDYHLEFFPKSWLEDIWPDLLKSSEELSGQVYVQDPPEQPVEKMLDVALRSGCDVMVLN